MFTLSLPFIGGVAVSRMALISIVVPEIIGLTHTGTINDIMAYVMLFSAITHNNVSKLSAYAVVNSQLLGNARYIPEPVEHCNPEDLAFLTNRTKRVSTKSSISQQLEFFLFSFL